MRTLILSFCCLVAVGAFAQENESVQQARTVKEPYQGGWSATPQQLWNVLEEQKEVSNSELFMEYRRQRNASLAKNNGTVPIADQKKLDDIADRIDAVAPNSFEAHMAGFYAQFPDQSAFTELDLATEKDMNRIELVGPQLMNAARKNDASELAKWSKALKERGEVAPALWSFADDLLISVAKNAILFTAGEMDAYPIWAKQYADGKRTDVLVVDERLLVDAAYRKVVWSKAGAKGDPVAANGFIVALAAATDRPVHVSLALGQDVASPLRNNLFVTGLAARFSTGAEDNIPVLEANWTAMRKATEAGPIAKNYLLPASILLKHYRAVGNEEKASLLEYELRQMATKLGAMDRLYRAGVLQH